jgi:Flp pilus assembly protein CpaB
MEIIDGLLLGLALLGAGTAGWLLSAWRVEQDAAERAEEEQEMEEFQDLYAAWVTSHRKH